MHRLNQFADVHGYRIGIDPNLQIDTNVLFRNSIYHKEEEGNNNEAVAAINVMNRSQIESDLQEKNMYLMRCNDTLSDKLNKLQDENNELKSSIFIRYIEELGHRFKFIILSGPNQTKWKTNKFNGCLRKKSIKIKHV